LQAEGHQPLFERWPNLCSLVVAPNNASLSGDHAVKNVFVLVSSILLSFSANATELNCQAVLQKQFAAIMNAQSGWNLAASDISVGSLYEGMYTVSAGPKVGEKGSEYLVAVWGETDCRITSMVEAESETSTVDITWKKGQ
jgi:hypothetical protein